MSLKEIAQLANTSVSTVSRVLNKKEHSIKNKELSDLIWKIARDINYIPNQSAKSLRNGGLNNTATLLPKYCDVFLTRFLNLSQDPFFEDLYSNLKEELLPLGYHLNDIITLPDMTAKMARKHIIQGSAVHTEAIIILGKCPEELIGFIKNQYSAIVGIDRNPTNFEYAEVTCDGKEAARLAIDYLYSLGHKKIAYIGDCSYESRYVGYYQTLISHNLPLNHSFVYPCSQTKDEGYQIMKEIIKSSNRPTALLCANDITAIGVLNAIKSSKQKSYNPSIISIDNIKEAQLSRPALTTISIPIAEMAHNAALLLVDQISRRQRNNVRLELPAKLIVRETCYSI